MRDHIGVEPFRLLGGDVPGDNVVLPNAQLAVLPGTTHTTPVGRADWLGTMIPGFLDAPMPSKRPQFLPHANALG